MMLFSDQTMPKKRRLVPQNSSRSSGPEKLLKIVNYQNCQKIVLSQLEKVGGRRYPPGSERYSFTWIKGYLFKGGSNHVPHCCVQEDEVYDVL
jgi:hypothetical protein